VQAPMNASEPIVETLPGEERVRQRAYELYVERGNQSGSELDDWLHSLCLKAGKQLAPKMFWL
jgi:hypothetical protein